MRFMVMHKNDPHTEAGELPPPALIAEMGAFIMEHAQAGRFLGGEGSAACGLARASPSAVGSAP